MSTHVLQLYQWASPLGLFFTHDDRVQPLDERETPVTTGVYVRSGLLGFVGTGGLVFICGTMDGLIQIGARRHNTEDLIATVMAVEPHSFVYKGRYAGLKWYSGLVCVETNRQLGQD